jgi:hypothetical protein
MGFAMKSLIALVFLAGCWVRVFGYLCFLLQFLRALLSADGRLTTSRHPISYLAPAAPCIFFRAFHALAVRRRSDWLPVALVRDTAHKARGGSVPMFRHRSIGLAVKASCSAIFIVLMLVDLPQLEQNIFLIT